MYRRFLILLSAAMVACGPSPEDQPDVVSDAGSPASIGAACDEHGDCESGTCLSEADGWPAGYCTALECDPGSCQGFDTACGELAEQSLCVERCQPGDCRSGYACREVAVGTAGCVPVDSGPDPSDAFEPTRQALGFMCTDRIVGSSEAGALYALEFDISADAESFLMVPSVTQGTLLPDTLLTPSGTEVDLLDDYRHHNTRIFEMNAGFDLAGFGTFGQITLDWPILVPYAPQFSGYVEPGTYRLTLSTTSDAPCLYVMESTSGASVDLNVYMVGAPGFTADVARDDPDLQDVFSRVDSIFEPQGIELGDVDFYDVPDAVREQYRRPRSQEDAYQLTAYGSVPGDSVAERVSVDIFLVEDLVFSGTQYLGLAAGLPGAAGLHGNARNGLVFRTIDLGADNGRVAHSLAHELGHFLGLRHTTERIFGAGGTVEQQYDQALGTYDPIEDTAVCDFIRSDWKSCPDLDNLMFPSAPPDDMEISPTLTNGQGQVLRLSPLAE